MCLLFRHSNSHWNLNLFSFFDVRLTSQILSQSLSSLIELSFFSFIFFLTFTQLEIHFTIEKYKKKTFSSFHLSFFLNLPTGSTLTLFISSSFKQKHKQLLFLAYFIQFSIISLLFGFFLSSNDVINRQNVLKQFKFFSSFFLSSCIQLLLLLNCNSIL